MESDGKDGVSVRRQPEVQGVFPSCGYAEIVQGTGGHRPFRDRAPATISEMTAKSVSGLVELAKKLQESSRSKDRHIRYCLRRLFGSTSEKLHDDEVLSLVDSVL